MGYQAPDVARAAADLLGVRVFGDAVRIERGFGNENWGVATSDGDIVVKVGLAQTDPAKWAAATRAHALAADAGVPVPAMLAFTPSCEAVDGRVVRVIEFVDGVHPSTLLDEPGPMQRFFAELGAALATLHALPVPAFSSRLDGSAPEFATWNDYVEYRLPQIERRASGVLDAREFNHIAAIVRDAASSVSPVVVPSLTHRDLSFDNVLVAPDGRLTAVLDWDAAEAWDCAVDLVKPRVQMLPWAPADAAGAFWDAYPTLDQLVRRLLVVDLLEFANAVANARVTGDAAYEQRCRVWLAAALDSHRPGPA